MLEGSSEEATGTAPPGAITSDLPPHVYIMEDVSIRLSMEELQRRVLEEPWFEAEGFNRRAGLTIAGGSLLGVTTSLTTVLDKWKSEVGESADEEGAKGLIPFLPKEGAPYTTQVAWDSEEAKDVSNFLLRSWNLAPRELLRDVRDVQSNDLREDKRQLLIRVSDSISALAQGFQEADKASGCFFCSAFLSGMDGGVLEQFASDPSTLTQFQKDVLREPINIMQRAMHDSASGNLVMVLPVCGLSVMQIRQLVPTLRQLFPSRVLVLVQGSAASRIFPAQLVAAITRCGLQPPRRALMAAVSGGSGVLSSMAFCAKHGVRLIVFDGSGRLSDLWGSIWHERDSSTFDPVLQQQRLSHSFCYQAGEAEVSLLHMVMNKAELVIHPVANSAAALERLCMQQLLGDPLLVIANGQLMGYERASARYEWPRMLLTNTSICLALVSTVLAALVAEGDRSSVGFFLCIILPGLLMIVDQVDVYLGMSVAAHAVERARGIVEQQAFMYRARIAGYSDAALARQLKEAAINGATELIDVETGRQQLFTRRLSEIDEAASAAGALVDVIHMAIPGGSSATTRVVPSDAAPHMDNAPLRPAGSPGGDVIDGDEYIRLRVNPYVKRSAREAKRLLFLSLLARLGLFVVAAVSTAIATIGYTKYVSVTVAVTTAITRWLNATRVEARRSAHSRAASALNSAKLAWTALPREMRSRQAERDRLVLRVENLLERTLPPAENEVSS